MSRFLALALALGNITDLEFILLSRAKKRRQKRAITERFRLKAFSNVDCLDMFRFAKNDIRRLRTLLRFPLKFRLRNGMLLPTMEVLCLVLARLSYPCRFKDLRYLFRRHRTILSNMFNIGVNFIYIQTKSLLTTLNSSYLTAERLEMYAEASAAATDDLSEPMNVWAYLDGTTRPICRPIENQRLVYNGKDRVHALKYQAVTTLDGIIVHLAGPIEGARHDSHMLRESGLLELLNEKMITIRKMYRLYGDAAYSINDVLLTPYRNAKKRKEIRFNEILAQVRVAVEWSFGNVVQEFAFTDYRKNQKLLLQPVAQQYIVSVALTNMHTCINQSLCGKTFHVIAPTLEEYLSDVPEPTARYRVGL